MPPQFHPTRLNVHTHSIAEKEHELLKNLFVIVDRLQARVTYLETQIASPKFVQPPLKGDADGLEHVMYAMRNALRHLNDIAKLADSELAHKLAELGHKPMSGRMLQSMLNAAIRALQPTVPSTTAPHAQLYYEILHLTYQDRISPDEIAQCLAIS